MKILRRAARGVEILATQGFVGASGLFDAAYYLEEYPDVAAAGIDPLLHYLNTGAAERRNPHPLFDTGWYLEQCPGQDEAARNPLLHYLQRGARQGLSPHPVFDPAYYLAEVVPASDVAQKNPLAHYLREGDRAGLDPHPLFDTSYYRTQRSGDASNSLIDYLSQGVREGRNPHPLFDGAYYLACNPDVLAAGVNPLVHFIRYGATELRDPHPLFETSFYLEQEGDRVPAGMNPLVHFIQEGPSDRFDPLGDHGPAPDSGICIVSPDLLGPVKNGGIGTACYQFARTLAAAGHTVSVFFTCELHPSRLAHWRNQYARRGLGFIGLPDDRRERRIPDVASNWFFDRSWRIYERLRDSHFTVIHFQDWQANGFWSFKAKAVGLAFTETPLTVMLHSGTRWINQGMQQFPPDAVENAKLIWAETYCIESADLLLSPSRHMFAWAAENGIALPAERRLMHYVYDELPLPAGETHHKAPPRGRRGHDHLVFFGRLETRKGVHVFADALRLMQRDGVPLPRLVSFLGKAGLVLGEPALDYLARLRHDLPGVEFIVQTGLDASAALAYIRESGGIAILPSLVDNYPLAVIECIQLGIPFLASRAGGIPEMADGRILFEPAARPLADLLRTRDTIDHAAMKHPYSARESHDAWLHLHENGGAAIPRRSRPSVAPEASRPLVSVCIPFYCHEQYLSGLLDVFRAQDYPAFEVVIVNDGSGEPSTAAFEHIAGAFGDARFRFLTTANQGPGAARNLAAREAKGELLVFFDADNLPRGSDFITRLAAAREYADADCVTAAHDIINAGAGDRVVARYRPLGYSESALFENILGDATFIVKRTVFEAAGGFPEAGLREDYRFLLEVAFRRYRLEVYPEPLYFYRRSAAGRNRTATLYDVYDAVLRQLARAPASDLARFVTAIGVPSLLAHYRPQDMASAHAAGSAVERPREPEAGTPANPARPPSRETRRTRLEILRGFLRYHLGPRKSFVMIACSMRSGSTLLKALLAEADDVSNLPEVNLRTYQGLHRYALYARLAELSRKRIVILKRPGFPSVPFDPRFLRLKVIVLVRDAVPVAESIVRMTHEADEVFESPWTRVQALDYWCEVYERILSDPRLAAHDMRVVRYEDLVRDPVKVTGELFAFIGSRRKMGTTTYRQPLDYEWRWGSDDGGTRIRTLEVQPPASDRGASPAEDGLAGLLAIPRVRRLRERLGYA